MRDYRSNIQTRLQENRHLVPRLIHLTTVDALDVEAAEDDLVPVDGRRRDHFQIHRQEAAPGAFDLPGRRVLRLRARADVLKIGESVAELAADQVELPGPAEVAPHGRGHAVRIHVLAAGLQETPGQGSLQARVFRSIH